MTHVTLHITIGSIVDIEILISAALKEGSFLFVLCKKKKKKKCDFLVRETSRLKASSSRFQALIREYILTGTMKSCLPAEQSLGHYKDMAHLPTLSQPNGLLVNDVLTE